VSLAQTISPDTHFSLGLTTGMIIANPIPALSEIPKHKMDKFINEAIQLAEANGITGKDNTPYILEKIKELSAGQSVIANRELVISNARCAAAIARILCTGYMCSAFARSREHNTNAMGTDRRVSNIPEL